MKKLSVIVLIACSLLLLNFCGDKKADQPEVKEAEKKSEKKADQQADQTIEKKVAEKPAGEPDRITVQHLLIGFKGTVPGKDEITRSQEEAKILAYELLEKIKGGADFDALVKEYTDDSHPGIYSMSNFGVTPDKQGGEYPRAGMVGAFGNVGFPLEVGSIGMADYDPKTSKYGWHIIKRLK